MSVKRHSLTGAVSLDGIDALDAVDSLVEIAKSAEPEIDLAELGFPMTVTLHLNGLNGMRSVAVVIEKE